MRLLFLVLYVLLGGATYAFWAYLGLSRGNFGLWLGAWGAAWVYFGLGWLGAGRLGDKWLYLAAGAMLWRLCWGWGLPSLSDDFWRFLWDGHLLAGGENPFDYTPRAWLSLPQSGGNAFFGQAFPLLNSADYYSLYPPLSQGWFWLGAVCGGDSIEGQVLALRLWLWLAELGAVWGLYKWLRSEGIDGRYVLLWVLNPFVIVEFSGQLHFEVAQLGLLFWSLWAWRRGYVAVWAIFFAFSVLCKLVPLILLPVFFFRLPSWGARWGYSLLIGGIVLGAWLPFVSVDKALHIGESLRLYVDKFGFNASLYYLFVYLGEGLGWLQARGEIGKYLYVWVFFWAWALAWLGWRRSWSVQATALGVIVGYYALATTLHPWYWLLPLGLGMGIGRWRWWVVCVSGLLFLSYSAYGRANFAESTIVLAIEYACIVAAGLWVSLCERDRSETSEREARS